MKRCRKCKLEKEDSDFSRARRERDGLQRRCKACDRAWRDANRPKLTAYKTNWARSNRTKQRAYARAAKYGITNAEFLSMFTKQHGVCAICRKPNSGGRQLAVDHCHTTGRVRGLLCTRCNLRVGVYERFGADCREYLARSAEAPARVDIRE